MTAPPSTPPPARWTRRSTGHRLPWLRRRLELWHPDSPGSRLTVDRPWPRYLWTPGPVESDRFPGHWTPSAFASLGEWGAVHRRPRRHRRIGLLCALRGHGYDCRPCKRENLHP